MKLEINSLVENPMTANEVHSESDLSQVSDGDITQNLKDGIAAAKSGNRAEAKVLLMRVTESDPQNETAWLWLASISEYPEELLVFLQNVLNINPQNERAIEWSKATKALLSKTFVQRGVTAAHSGNKELARQSFLQAIVYDGENEMAWLWLASVAEQTEEKLSHLNKVLSLNPNNETAISSMKVVKNQIAQLSLKKANQLAVVGERELANQHLEEVIKYDSELEEAWLLKAILTDSFDEKATYFNRVLSINPENIAAKAGLASIEAILQAAIAVPDINVEEPIQKEVENNEVELASDEEVFEAVERAFIDPNLENKVEAKETSTPAFVEESKPLEVTENKVTEEILETAQTAEKQEVEANKEILEVKVESIENFAQNEENLLESQPKVEEEEVEIQSFQDFSDVEEPKSAITQELVPLETVVKETQTIDKVSQTEEESKDFEEVSLSDEVSSFESFEAEPNNPYKTGELSSEVLSTASKQFYPEQKSSEPAVETSQESLSEKPLEFADFAQNESVKTPVEFVQTAEIQEKFESTKVEVREPEVFEQSELQSPVLENLPTEVEENETISEFADSFNETDVSKPVQTAEVEEKKVEVQSTQVADFQDFNKSFSQMQFVKCVFCQEDNTHGTAICHSCHSVLNLSDLDMLFDYQKADKEKLVQAIQRMEAEKNDHEFSAEEYSNLALAYLNTQNLKSAYSNLQKASALDPNNASLAAQMNQLDSRLSEDDKHDAPAETKTYTKIIMVVDDSPTVRKLVSTKLEKCGHTVVAAIDGMDALAKINETVPDLILLDITMPRLDGYQVCKLIRGNELTKDIPIIMISGKDGFFDKVRGRMAGSSGYITKPFGPDTLMRTLETHLGLGN